MLPLKSGAQDAVIDSLKQVAATSTDTNKVHALNKLILLYGRTDEDTALYYADLALEEAIAQDFIPGEGYTYKNMAFVYTVQSEYPMAIEYLKKARNTFLEINHKQEVASAYNNMGIVHFHQGNNYEALDAYSNALEMNIEIGHLKNQAHNLNNLGIVYKDIGDYPKALDHYYQSLKLKEELSMVDHYANAYNNIGVVYEQMGNYDKALEHYLLSLDISTKINDEESIAGALNNSGKIHTLLGNYEQAMDNHQKALEYNTRTKNRPGIGRGYIYIGDVHFKKNNYKAALEFYLDALTIFEETGNKKEEADALLGLSETHYSLGNYPQAEKHGLRAYSIAKDAGIKLLLKDICKNLSDIYRELGDFEKSLEYYELFTVYRESLFSSEKSKEIGRLEASHELDKKETENELLKKDQALADAALERKNTIIIAGIVCGALLVLIIIVLLLYNRKIKTYNQQLEHNESTLLKEVKINKSLLQEVHHRVKNNLQVISSLLNLQSNYIDDEKTRQAIWESNNRIKSMSLIHEALYQKDAIADLKLDHYLKSLIKDRIDSNLIDGVVNFEVDAPGIQLKIDTMVPLGLLVNELTTNSIKYAFVDKEEGMIQVHIAKMNDGYSLTYKDDGKGFPEDFDREASKSLGQELIDCFVEQLDGTLAFETSPQGVQYHVEFKA